MNNFLELFPKLNKMSINFLLKARHLRTIPTDKFLNLYLSGLYCHGRELCSILVGCEPI